MEIEHHSSTNHLFGQDSIKVETCIDDTSVPMDEFAAIADVFSRFNHEESSENQVGLGDNVTRFRLNDNPTTVTSCNTSISGGFLSHYCSSGGMERSNDSTSWDSGVILDTNTVVQMAEFQEVVNNLQKELLLPPPPYPGHYNHQHRGSHASFGSDSAIPSVKVSSGDGSSLISGEPDHHRELDQLLSSTPTSSSSLLPSQGQNTSTHLSTQGYLLNQRSAVSYNGSENPPVVLTGCSVGHPRSLPACVDQVPNIVERVRSDTLTSRPPNFKQSRATSRTNMKQLLYREQCMEQHQKAQEQQQQLSNAAAAMLSPPSPVVDIPNQHKEIPTSVFKIETRLENPTKYHVIESQRRQVAEYLSSTPQSASDSFLQLPHSSSDLQQQLPHIVAINPSTSGNQLFDQKSQNGVQKIIHTSQRNGSFSHLSPLPQFTNGSSPNTPTSSGPGCSGVILENRRASNGCGKESRRPSGGGAGSRRPSDALSRRPSGGGPFSPSCSSATTSPSEYTPSEVGNCEDFLDEILSQGDNILDNNMLEFKDKIGDLVKEEPLGEEELKALQRDRIKKDNHNMIERRRRFNINDRIKELGHLLPKQSEQYYELVRDVRHNKGSILKASVDYIKILKKEKERKSALEEEMKRTKYQNKKLIQKLQEYEEMLSNVRQSEQPQNEQKSKSQDSGDDDIYMEH